MDKKVDDFCTSCGETRRGFLGKATKLLAGGTLAAAGVLGGDRWLQRQFTPSHRTATDDDIRAFLQDAINAPAWRQAMSPDDIKALEDGDVDYFRHLQVPVADPGQAGAICNYCYCYQLLNRASSSCSSGTSCWCYPKCYYTNCAVYYPAPYRLHCDAC